LIWIFYWLIKIQFLESSRLC